MEYKIVIDQALVDEYCEAYFKLHPRAHKKPIERPYHPSINEWCILPRIQMNALKQRHKDFMNFVVKKYGYENLNLDRFDMIVKIYKKTRIRGDCDNYTLKFWDDSLTESHMIVDDDYKHMRSIYTTMDIDKDNPRTEIIIKTIDNEEEK